MKRRDLKLVWLIFHVLIGYLKFTIKVLNFIGIWCHKIHLHLTYEWYCCKKGHYKITNSLDFGSTHIVGPWALRCHKQFKQLPKLVNLTHDFETSMIISFHSKGQWHAWSKFSLHKSLELAWRHPAFEHDFCHSHHPVPPFLVLVMVFCKMDCVFFIKIDAKPTYFESSMAWWHHLDIIWPWQDPTKGVGNLKISQDTIKIKVEVEVERLNFPLCLTYYVMT